MSPTMRFSGSCVSEGTAVGQLYLADTGAAAAATPDEVRSAFAAVAGNRRALAARLRAQGRVPEADIVEVAALIAGDPLLVNPAVATVRSGQDAATAVRQAAEAQAAIIEAIPNPELAERAGDIRQVAQAVLDRLAGGASAHPDSEFILVRREVAAADLIELAEQGLAGAASVAGGASSHAAIIARGLGVPMVTGVDAAVLAAPAGRLAMLDADAGELVIDPPAADRPLLASQNGHSARHSSPVGPAHTGDGQEITILCNVASAAETRRGLAAGAAGVGLLRTEIPFTGATAWPTEAEHLAQLEPILGLLAGRAATVRLLDFSGDKIPPFLREGEPGLAALLGHPTALRDQLRAALTAGRDTRLAILVPMVSSPAEVDTVRDLLAEAAAALGAAPPRLGIMVELEATAAAAQQFAAAVDFLSIGTNDLTGQVLSLDRQDPRARPALAAHPRVLTLVGHVAAVAADAGIGLSVCGDAAADLAVLPLLVGLGVRTLSVPAARVERVRGWISHLDSGLCAALAAQAVRASGIDQVRELVQRAAIS